MHVDFGTGDGTSAYRLAKGSAGLFVVGVDAVAENLREVSHRAGRKPEKGGLPNVVFGELALESAPGALEGLAGSLSVILPWGSLLHAVAIPSPPALAKLRACCRRGAKVEIVFGYGERDHLALPLLTEQHLEETLPRGFRAAGFEVRARSIGAEAVRAFGSTWAKKLAVSNSDRLFIAVKGIAAGGEG